MGSQKSSLTVVRFTFMPIFLLFLLLFANSASPQSGCPDSLEVLDIVQVASNTEYHVYSNGTIYTRDSTGMCAFFQQYFDPDFLANNYLITDTALFQYTDTRQLFRIRNSIHENFESYTWLGNCIMRSIADSGRNWSTVTLQSPLAKTVPEYVALRTCLFDSTCDFRDNRIDFIQDPLNAANRCMKLLAMAPTVDMVTSKTSIENTVLFFQENDTLLFEGRYLIQSGMPYSLADFESQWFDQSPGPRIVISGGHLAVELKYGPKPMYRQRAGAETDLPIGAWVRVRLRMAFRHDSTALIRLWQDDKLVLDTLGRTLGTRNSIQTNLEIGISATSERTELCVDDISLERLPAASNSGVEKKKTPQASSSSVSLSILSGFNSTHLILAASLPASSGAVLALFDIRGRVLEKRVIRSEKSGVRSVSMDLSAYPSGLYLCRLAAAGKMACVKTLRY